MRVVEYKNLDRSEWSRLVASSATGTWFQTPEAFEFFESMPDIFRPFVVGVASLPSSRGRVGDRPQLRGVCVGYVTVEKSPIKQFFTRRAIIIGGPALADDATDEEVNALLCALKSTLLSGREGVGSPIYIETRNFNDYSKWKEAFEKAEFEYQPHLNFHIDCTDREAMWERLSETRRRQIKKVTNEGVGELTNKGISEQDVREWYSILAELYRTKVKTPLWPVEFFLEAYRQGVGKYLLVKHEGKVIGGVMCPIFGDRSIYEWYICGMDSEYKECYPSVMATWAAMDYANRHGIARFDVMGAGEPGVPYGVRDFKAEFGGKMVEHGRFIYVSKPILYKIGKMAVGILKSNKE